MLNLRRKVHIKDIKNYNPEHKNTNSQKYKFTKIQIHKHTNTAYDGSVRKTGYSNVLYQMVIWLNIWIWQYLYFFLEPKWTAILTGGHQYHFQTRMLHQMVSGLFFLDAPASLYSLASAGWAMLVMVGEQQRCELICPVLPPPYQVIDAKSFGAAGKLSR